MARKKAPVYKVELAIKVVADDEPEYASKNAYVQAGYMRTRPGEGRAHKERRKNPRGFDRILFDLCSRIGDGMNLAQAARDVNVAYTAAWKYVRTAEEYLGQRLLEGERGIGSQLTPFCKQLVEAYAAATDEAFVAFVDIVGTQPPPRE